jgi:hypothetical protein
MMSLCTARYMLMQMEAEDLRVGLPGLLLFQTTQASPHRGPSSRLRQHPQEAPLPLIDRMAREATPPLGPPGPCSSGPA